MTARPRARVGVRGRLLLAFLGISGFAVLAAAAALFSFLTAGKAIDRITEQQMPAALAAMELPAVLERLVTVGPAILAASDEAARKGTFSALPLGQIRDILAARLAGSVEPSILDSMTQMVGDLERNLHDLDSVVAERLAVKRSKDRLLWRLAGTLTATQRLLAPAIVGLEARLAERRSIAVSQDAPQATASDALEAIVRVVPLQKAQFEIAAINDGLLKAAEAPTAGDLPLLAFALKRGLLALEAIVPELEAGVQHRLRERTAELAALIEGEDSIPRARERELVALVEGDRLLAENVALSRSLTGAAGRVVAQAEAAIAAAAAQARDVQRVAMAVLAGIVALSLLSSGLIVWLYVDRSLVARLDALSRSMLAIASGDLRTALPEARGDEIGQMAGALRVFRDTAVEVEEGRLRERQVVLDTIDYGVLILDPELRVRLFNRAFVDLLRADEAVLRGWPVFRDVMELSRERGIYEVSDEGWPLYAASRVAEIEAGEVTAREWRLADGRVVEYQCVPLPDGGRMLTYLDLTRQKQIEAELRAAKDRADHASRHKSAFLSSMSHELRTPLNAVLGYTELIQDGIYGEVPEKIHEVLGRVQASGKHLLGLINDVLDLSKIEAGQLVLARDELALGQVVESVISATGALARDKGLVLAAEVAPGLPWGVGDERRITQVLLNLVGNAIKFTGAGRVTISVGLENGCYLIAVADTGPGIPADQRDRIFEEFQQVDGSLTRQKGGTGLGLSISRRIIDLHGGRIWVESELGRGATFRFTLPLRPPIVEGAET